MSSPKQRSQHGFSIIELMVALIIGLFVVSVVLMVFRANRQTYRFQEAVSQLQDNGRFTLERLNTRLRMTGYAGCYNDFASGVEINVNAPTTLAWNLARPLEGFDNVSASQSIGGIANFISGTDVLVMKSMANGVPLASNPDTNTFTIAAVNNQFSTGDIILVSDCEQASLFQATTVTTTGAVTTINHNTGTMTPGNSAATVSNRYTSDAEIGRFGTYMYYLKNAANGRPALYEASLTVTGTVAALREDKLVSNVENLQFVYGVDNDADGDADVYQTAGAVADWSAVVSVRMALLLASTEDNLLDNKQSYSFNASTFTFTPDSTPAASATRRLRRVFTGFGTVRNRVL